MRTKLQPGQQVTVNAFGGKRMPVIVVEDRGDIVLVCKEEEFENAKAGNREPLAAGVHPEDISEFPHKKTAASEDPGIHQRSRAGD